MKHESIAPFRPPFRPLTSGNLFKRSLAARTLASLRRISAADIAAEMWPNDRNLADLLTVRATSAPAMTTVVGWAAELAQKFVTDTIEALGAASGASEVMKASLLLMWDRYGILSAPAFSASAANSGFVAEGQPIPVHQLNLTPALIQPYKLATIAVLTREMVESSNAEALISDALVISTGIALDAAFFDANAATAARPAGIRNGIAASPASANTDPFGAFFEDVSTLISSVGRVGGRGPFFLVGSAGRIASMRTRFVTATEDVVPVMSSAVGNDLIAIAPKALASAISPEPDVETSSAATLVMDDTAPGAAGTAGPEKEVFQSESLATKVRWPVSWALRDPRAVAWLTPGWK